MSTIELATTVAIGTALVLAPIPAQAVRDLNASPPEPQPAPAPESEPAFDEALIARVRTGLDLLPHWRPRPELGETETRILLWSQLELNALYERAGGTVTTAQVEHTSSDGQTWTEEEITVTVDVPGVGPVQAVTGWCDDLAKYGARDTLPLMRAIAPTPQILETAPARGQLLGYDRFAIAPGAPLPDGRTIATVEDPLGSSWRVTDDHGRVHWLHKYGQLVRYTSGTVAFIESEWAGWSSD
ncbi:hypothetical protein ACFZB5_13600 [Streptomyces nodosus]|uniref:hypothetical protein n=1 Tax=Streptomyces nodosus TaxID=40318 RepID=UPI0036EAD388